MPELRWILLGVGLVFLVGLALWEARRGHQARGSELPPPVPEPPLRAPERSSDWDLPALDLPRMSARDPEAQLPVVEIAPEDFAALEARAEGSAESLGDLPADPAAEEFVPQFSDEIGVREAADAPPALKSAWEEPAVQASTPPAMGGMDHLLAELGASQQPDPPISDITESFGNGSAPDEGFEVHSATVRTLEMPPPPAPEPAPVAPVAALPEPQEPHEPQEPPQPPVRQGGVVVDWPAAEASKVLAVRLVSQGEKFSGRAVRMALAAEGFALGKFSIFHKPAADGRALLSIASLNKPGTFDARSIDLQRYSGLNLFTVLPGPMPGPDAVDEMLMCAQVLSQRLRGALQDEQGAPLSPARTALMRNAAAAARP